MKQDEIIAKNKIIAEFMGGKMWVSDYHGINIIKMPNGDTIDLHGLKYHSSWDWLMPVVEKIEGFIFENDEYYNFNILGGCHVIIISSHGNELVTSDNGQTKLECVWFAVIEFIKWYNENK